VAQVESGGAIDDEARGRVELPVVNSLSAKSTYCGDLAMSGAGPAAGTSLMGKIKNRASSPEQILI
jgi:hypothetical protein